MRPVGSVHPATEPRAPGKRVPNSTCRDGYVYLMQEYKEVDVSFFEDSTVAASQTGLQARAPLGTVLHESYVNIEQMLTEMLFGTNFLHAVTGTAHLFRNLASHFLC